MAFIVALHLPWCWYLGAQVGVQRQLYADHLKCVTRDPGVLLRAARFTIGYVRLVGQEPAPSKCVLMSTSRAVRSDMRGWVVTDEGDRWSVKLDVRDIGRHLDTTFQGWFATLAARVRLVIARLVLIFVLPLDFHGELRLFGLCQFLVLFMELKLPFSVCVSCALPFFVLFGLVDSHLLVLERCLVCWGCDPALCVVWIRFRMLRRYLAYRPEEVPTVNRLIDSASGSCPRHGPAHLLFAMPGRTRYPLICVRGRVFGVALCLIFQAPCSSLALALFGRDKALLRGVLVGEEGRGGLEWFSLGEG